MNIRRTGERKNIAVFAILPTVCEGHVIPARRKVTSTPGIRPTGSLRIALGERCFREPSLQAALVRLTFQCMVGSRLPRQSAASIAEMPCRLPGVPRNTSRPLQATLALKVCLRTWKVAEE
jgi:hypothetical protein